MVWIGCNLLNGLRNFYCEDDLWCGVLWQKWWVLWWQCKVLLWWHPLCLLCDLEEPLWELWQLWLLYLCGLDCNLDLLCLYLSWWWHLEVDLVWCLVLEFCLWWHAGVPDGGILSGQSTTIWPYLLHSKQCTFGQWCAMWPCSWHWKHWSSSLDITWTVDEGNKVTVNCYTAWSFSISLMSSARVWGLFS